MKVENISCRFSEVVFTTQKFALIASTSAWLPGWRVQTCTAISLIISPLPYIVNLFSVSLHLPKPKQFSCASVLDVNPKSYVFLNSLEISLKNIFTLNRRRLTHNWNLYLNYNVNLNKFQSYTSPVLPRIGKNWLRVDFQPTFRSISYFGV